MFRLCLLAWGAAAISTDAIVDDVDATLRSALSHLREHLKVDVRATDAARLKDAPNLVQLLATARDDPETLAEQLAASPLGAVVREVSMPTHTKEGANALPIVTAHGMGDSCFNAGMKSVTAAAGKRVGAYAVCVPTADTQVGDTVDGFLKNMDRSVDAFAERVRKDPKLKNGFNALGLSQGNNVIRGSPCGHQMSGAPCCYSLVGFRRRLHREVQRPARAHVFVHLWVQRGCRGVAAVLSRRKIDRARLPGARRGFG